MMNNMLVRIDSGDTIHLEHFKNNKHDMIEWLRINIQTVVSVDTIHNQI